MEFREYLEGLDPDDALAAAEKEALTSPEKAYYHARKVVRGRWPGGEDLIATSPHYSYYYAIDVIKGRFPESEDSILGSMYLRIYVRNVLKPWLEKHPEDRAEVEEKFGEWL